MATAGITTTSSASMLEATSRDAGAEVADGVYRIRRLLTGRIDRPAQLPLYLYVAVRQLYRTYLTLTWEVSHVSALDTSVSAALDRLARAQLVQRIHRTGGDFALIGRVCQALRPHADDPRVAEAEEVLLSWTDREAHLFCMLVPLANFADELRKEVTQLLYPGEASSSADLAARLREAERAMAPVLRQLGESTQLLHQLSEELKPLTSNAPAEAKEMAVMGTLRSTSSKGMSRMAKEIAS